MPESLEKLSPKELAKKALAGDPAAIRELRRRGATGAKKQLETSCPLSNAQKRLWMFHRLDRENPAYNMPAAFTLTGDFRPDVFEQAIRTLVQRHESLRTVFGMTDGSPCEIIKSREALWGDDPICTIIDLTRQADPEAEAKKHSREDAITPFNLETGPLLRIFILQMPSEAEEAKQILLFNMHHIISDGWSIDIIIHEISMLYNAFSKNQPDPLPPLRIQHRDIVLWQKKQRNTPEMADHRDFWLQKLSGDLPVLSLRTDFPRPAIQAFKGDSEAFSVSPKMTAQLNQLAQTAGASMFMVMTAALKALFYRYTGQEEIILGAPAAGRNHPDLEDQIGFYVNLLALRDRVSGAECFSDLLKRVKKTATEAYEHQDYPFDILVDELKQRRDLSRSPVFDVVIAYQNQREAEFSLTGVSMEPKRRPFPVSRFDLTFFIEESGQGLTGEINFDTSLFRNETIQRLGTHLERILAKIAETPEIPIKELDIVPEEEKRKIDEFNNIQAGFPAEQLEKTIPMLFKEQAARTPDRIAVVFKETELTYAELNRRTDRLGSLLARHLTPGAEERVAVCLPRSHWRIVGLLAILKAGGVYVPVDPEYPEERIRYILEDSECKMILTDTEGREALAAGHPKAEVIDITQFEVALPDEAPPAERCANPDALAYIIYTSGSTGRPKGTMLAHRGFVNTILYIISLAGITAEERVLQFFSCSFDGSMVEIFAALFSGGALICFEDSRIKDSNAFTAGLREENITFATLPPTYIKTIGFDSLTCLRALVTAGEAAISDRGVLAASGTAYWNFYGPTEASVAVSGWRVPEKKEAVNLLIGRPFANIQICILDPSGDAVQPVGVPGEICVTGIGLAKGYLNRPNLTREKFVKHPCIPGERLYRTGDLGCWMPDGNIEHLGRIDDQVKIRGFRIEPGEISERLATHPAVNEAVVRAVDVGGQHELAAYFTGDSKLSPAELKNHLRQSLPEYMVPAHIIPLDLLPQTPNNKLDTKALPHPAAFHAASAERILAGTETETIVSEIWQQVLGIEGVGIHDNFFDLGGNSIRIIRMQQRIEKRFNMTLAVAELFQYPTVHAIAERLDGASERHEEKTEAAEKRRTLRAGMEDRRKARLRRRKKGK